MKSRLLSVILSVLLLQNCTTEPEINFEKLEKDYFVYSVLWYSAYYGENFSQRVYVQRVRYLVEFVFKPEEEQSFGIEGAQVIVSGEDSIYHFEDLGFGIYELTRGDSIGPFQHGKAYSLRVLFPDGNIATSEIITPAIYPDDEKDTLWIWPDSITAWTFPETGGKYPLSVVGPHFADTLHFRASEGAYASALQPSRYGYAMADAVIGLYGYPLYVKIDTAAYSNFVRTAIDSPGVFRSKYEPTLVEISFGAGLRSSADLDYMMSNDFWPIEDIEELSNISGAYGVFTAAGWGVSRPYIVALKEP